MNILMSKKFNYFSPKKIVKNINYTNSPYNGKISTKRKYKLYISFLRWILIKYYCAKGNVS